MLGGCDATTCSQRVQHPGQPEDGVQVVTALGQVLRAALFPVNQHQHVAHGEPGRFQRRDGLQFTVPARDQVVYE